MQRVGMNQHRLNQDELLRISRAISDTTRYALLEKIYFDQQITVGELCAESTVSAATVAHHIKILNDAGLIQVRRQGRYRLLVAQGNTWETYLDCLANLGKAALTVMLLLEICTAEDYSRGPVEPTRPQLNLFPNRALRHGIAKLES
jgi:ArsR family transcriptional regulator